MIFWEENCVDCCETLNKLAGSYPFIYQTESLGPVYIGLSVFRECSDEEKKLYKEYCNEINDLKSAGKGDKCLRECDTDRLSDILNEILKKGDVPYNSKEARKCREDLRERLCNMSQKELDELSSQRDTFGEALYCRDRAGVRKMIACDHKRA